MIEAIKEDSWQRLEIPLPNGVSVVDQQNRAKLDSLLADLESYFSGKKLCAINDGDAGKKEGYFVIERVGEAKLPETVRARLRAFLKDIPATHVLEEDGDTSLITARARSKV